MQIELALQIFLLLTNIDFNKKTKFVLFNGKCMFFVDNFLVMHLIMYSVKCIWFVEGFTKKC